MATRHQAAQQREWDGELLSAADLALVKLPPKFLDAVLETLEGSLTKSAFAPLFKNLATSMQRVKLS
eukprot:SAG11_NODE_14583_length_607_cov_0.421260_2_plen_66_part_01